MPCTCREGPACIKCGGPTLTNEKGATFCTDGCGYPDLVEANLDEGKVA